MSKTGRAAVVTGAADGLGQAFAVALAGGELLALTAHQLRLELAA